MLHNPYHNSFLDYFPMSYKLHKKSSNFFEGLKVAHKQFTLEWQWNTTYR